MEVETLRTALKRCDRCRSYAELNTVFEHTVRPVLDKLLHTPLVRLPRDQVVPDECGPAVAAVREWLTHSDKAAQYGTDDVWFFFYRTAATMLERAQDETRSSNTNKKSRKRARVEALTTNINNSDETPSPRTTLLTNCFILFCDRSLPSLASLTLRWGFLKAEKARIEASDRYVNANAAERRRMQLGNAGSGALCVFAERAHRHYFTAFWLQCMTQMDRAALHVHLMSRLGTVILPNLTSPLVVADYLTGCFHSGGLIAILALQSLFVLMLDHGLEYPQYYEQLYSLITPHSFASRHRYDLFRLLDLSMSSVRVPAYIAACIVKRVARVALLAPLPTLYFALPFIRKLLQRHPNCLGLIHRHSKEALLPNELPVIVEEVNNNTDGGQSTSAVTTTKESDLRAVALRERAALFDGIDPYDPNASLASAHALNSTLWELTALERHFLPTVPLMVAAYGSTAEDNAPLRYLKTYARLFTAEVTRVVDKHHMPTVAYQEPSADVCNELLHL